LLDDGQDIREPRQDRFELLGWVDGDSLAPIQRCCVFLTQQRLELLEKLLIHAVQRQPESFRQAGLDLDRNRLASLQDRNLLRAGFCRDGLHRRNETLEGPLLHRLSDAFFEPRGRDGSPIAKTRIRVDGQVHILTDAPVRSQTAPQFQALVEVQQPLEDEPDNVAAGGV
jgi:hypothetical protein